MGPSHRHLNRRDFVCTTGGALLASAWNANRVRAAGSAPSMAQWRPCVDVASIFAPRSNEPLDQPPVRESENDPLAPVDYALLGQNPQLSNLISRAPSDARAAAAQQLASPAEMQDADLPAQAPLQMAVESKWKIDKLKVFFYGNPAPRLIAGIIDIASVWSQYAKIDFSDTPRSNDANIRLAVRSIGGHWSYVGTDNINVGGQTMNLELTELPRKGDYNYGVILHEFGHALGCIHEHQNPNAGGFFDEQAVYAYYSRKYGWSREKIALNVLKRYQHSQLLRGFVTALDRRSIMMYSNPAELTLDRQGTPENVELSDTDKATIARLYPGRANVPKPPVEGDQQPETPMPSAALTADGPAVEGALTINAPVNTFDFEVSEAGTYTLISYGATQIVWKLLRSSGDEVQLRNKTPDLVNLVAFPELSTGKYRLEVRHKYSLGVGEYGVQLLKGKR